MINSSSLKKRWETLHQQEFEVKQPEKAVIEFVNRVRENTIGIVLDAGCGRGRNSRYLSKQGMKVIGCDISFPAIKVAKSKSNTEKEKIVYQISDLNRLPYMENAFDAIICVHVLPYNTRRNLFECVEELHRVLKPKGNIYFDLLDCEDVEYGEGVQAEERYRQWE